MLKTQIKEWRPIVRKIGATSGSTGNSEFPSSLLEPMKAAYLIVKAEEEDPEPKKKRKVIVSS